MKGNAEIHIGNDKFRKGWDGIKKACGCPFGEKCRCKKYRPAFQVWDDPVQEVSKRVINTEPVPWPGADDF